MGSGVGVGFGFDLVWFDLYWVDFFLFGLIRFGFNYFNFFSNAPLAHPPAPFDFAGDLNRMAVRVPVPCTAATAAAAAAAAARASVDSVPGPRVTPASPGASMLAGGDGALRAVQAGLRRMRVAAESAGRGCADGSRRIRALISGV